MMMAGHVAMLVLAGSLVLGGVEPARAADPVDRHPDIVFVSVPLLRGQMLRVCVRHVGRSRSLTADRQTDPAPAEVVLPATWRILATDPGGALLVRSEPMPLPAVGQFACQDVARDEIAQPGEGTTGLLQIALGLVVDAPRQRSCRSALLSSMQPFDLTAESPRPVGSGWIGKGASAFGGELTAEELV